MKTAAICPICSVQFEFEDVNGGQEATCPSCAGSILLPAVIVGVSEVKKLNFIQKWLRNRRGLKKYESEICLAHDRQFQSGWLESLQDVEREFDLNPKNLSQLNLLCFEAYWIAQREKGVTLERLMESEQCMRELRVSNYPSRSKAEMHFFGKALSILNGTEPPNLPTDDIILAHNDTLLWVEPASLIEERVISKRYEGGSSGVNFRVAKGVNLRVGAHRGHLVAEKADIPVSVGRLFLTTQKLQFVGDRKNFSIPLRKITLADASADEIRISDDKDKPRYVQMSQPGVARPFAEVVRVMVQKSIS